MSDIDGKDAFEMLLDRIADIIHEANSERQRANQAVSDLIVSRNENQRLAQRLAAAEADLRKREEGDPKLAELHLAAQAADVHLVAAQGVRDRLKAAADAAGPWCGEIPF